MKEEFAIAFVMLPVLELGCDSPDTAGLRGPPASDPEDGRDGRAGEANLPCAPPSGRGNDRQLTPI